MPPDAKKRIIVFLLVNLALSSVFYFLLIYIGTVRAGGGLYVAGHMWCPALAALIACKICKKSYSELGWGWGKTRYQVWSYLLPLGYSSITYAIVWFTGLGGFNREWLNGLGELMGQGKLPPAVSIFLGLILSATVGVIGSLSRALGEEIGWRGFLVPELARGMSFTKVSLVSGVIWSAWHFPVLLFTDFNAGTPAWYGLSCFTVVLTGFGFAFAWLRLKSGSLWTGAILHAAHNLFIQNIFNRLTTDTGITEYVIDEFGAALAIMAIIIAIIFWKLRHRLAAEK